MIAQLRAQALSMISADLLAVVFDVDLEAILAVARVIVDLVDASPMRSAGVPVAVVDVLARRRRCELT